VVSLCLSGEIDVRDSCGGKSSGRGSVVHFGGKIKNGDMFTLSGEIPPTRLKCQWPTHTFKFRTNSTSLINQFCYENKPRFFSVIKVI